MVLLEDLHWLDPQSEDFIEWLIESYPGTRTLALAIRGPILQRTGGNPFFVEEVARALIRDGRAAAGIRPHEVLELADEAVAGYVPSSARLGLGMACIAAGRLPEAVAALEDGLRKARSSSDLAEECYLVTFLAWAHQAAGNGEAALRAADGAMGLIARRGAHVMECALLAARAAAYRSQAPGRPATGRTTT